MLNAYQLVSHWPLCCQFIAYCADCILIGCCLYQSYYSYDLAVCAVRQNSSQLEAGIIDALLRE